MNRLWIQVLMVMVGGTLLKYLIYGYLLPASMLQTAALVFIDLAILGVVYMMLRRYPLADFKITMLILGGLTAVAVLEDLGLISDFLGTILILALLAWMLYRNGGGGDDWRRRKPSLRHKWHK